jgi:G-patch domain
VSMSVDAMPCTTLLAASAVTMQTVQPCKGWTLFSHLQHHIAAAARCRYVRGQGLGREKQGIAKPVEARLRGKGVGLGFGEKGRTERDEEKQPPAAAQVYTAQCTQLSDEFQGA